MIIIEIENWYRSKIDIYEIFRVYGFRLGLTRHENWKPVP